MKPGSPGINFKATTTKSTASRPCYRAIASPISRKRPATLTATVRSSTHKWKGYVALEDNYTTAGQKTALYLKKSNLASIANPDDMTPAEIKTVVDFLIDKKKEGQFRTLWSSFEQAVNLLVSKEVKVLDCWEPMVSQPKPKA